MCHCWFARDLITFSPQLTINYQKLDTVKRALNDAKIIMRGVSGYLFNAGGLLHIRLHRNLRARGKRGDVPSWLRGDWRGMLSYCSITNPIWFSGKITLFILTLT